MCLCESYHKYSYLFCLKGLPLGGSFAIIYSEGEARAKPLEIKKMNRQIKTAVAIQLAKNAYDGVNKSVTQIAEMLNLNTKDVDLVISELVSSGVIEVCMVQDANPFTGSQCTSKRYLPVIDGKGRGYPDRHLFSKKQYISTVL